MCFSSNEPNFLFYSHLKIIKKNIKIIPHICRVYERGLEKNVQQSPKSTFGVVGRSLESRGTIDVKFWSEEN